MPAARSIGEVLAEYAQVLTVEHDVTDILQTLGDYCTELLPVHGMGVLLLDNGRLSVATHNTAEGERVEDLEAELGEGPCTDAVRTGRPVLVPDVAEMQEHYPRFAPAALDAGVRAIHGLPMNARSEHLGALDVVSTRPGALSPQDVATAQLLADVTIAYIVNFQAREADSRLAGQLQYALDNRVIIEQAKGTLAERHGESPAAAFERLRSHARSTQASVRTVADQVVAGSLAL